MFIKRHLIQSVWYGKHLINYIYYSDYLSKDWKALIYLSSFPGCSHLSRQTLFMNMELSILREITGMLFYHILFYSAVEEGQYSK